MKRIFLSIAFNLVMFNAYASVEEGRIIYQQGILPSGAPVISTRLGTTIEGKDAACANCHKASGLGGLEGRILNRPVSALALFQPGGVKPSIMDPRTPRGIVLFDKPYTDLTLAATINTSIKNDGNSISNLMPKYNLSDADMKSLIEYMRTLSNTVDPGVGENVVKFGIVFTPDVSDAQRKIVKDMVNAYFANRNASWHQGLRRMRMGVELIPRTERDWVPIFWELKGDKDSWKAQLSALYVADPVFALVSGVSNTTWQPIDDYCEATKIPCMFPSVNLATTEGQYQFYFSKGVTLEAEILSTQIKGKRVLQLYKDGIGHAAADTFGSNGSNKVVSINVNDVKLKEYARKANVVIAWLSNEDLKLVPKSKATFVSATMLNEQMPNIKAKIVYPFELGLKRIQQDYPLTSWLNTYNIPLTDRKLQSEVFFNCFLLSQVTAQMLDNFYRDYFVELVESTLSAGTNRTLYPWISSGPGQRFVSNGGYIVEASASKFVALTQKIIP